MMVYYFSYDLCVYSGKYFYRYENLILLASFNQQIEIVYFN